MGLFHKNKKTDDGVDLDQEEQFFDENFREELRNHGRWYFDRVIDENGSLFKKDLDATIAQINVELKDHVTQQLDLAITQMNTELKDHVTQQLQDQMTAFTQSMKSAQDTTLQSMTQSAQELKQQHDQLSQTLRGNITEQESLLHAAFDENKARIISMSDAQDEALRSLKSSTQALQEQHQQLVDGLKKDVDAQKQILVDVFEDNMAKIVETYLLGALGDQYDMKAQLPSIIGQMEANKQAIMDDIQL